MKLIHFFLLFLGCFILYGCPGAKSYRYKYIKDNTGLYDKSSFISYNGNSIEVVLNYTHVFEKRIKNRVFGQVRVVSDNTIDRDSYQIKITSLAYKNIPSIEKFREEHYYRWLRNKSADSLNIFFFEKLFDSKSSLKKLKNDTISLSINDSVYKFVQIHL